MEWKLKRPWCEQPIHSARSLALASEVESARMRILLSVWREMQG